MGLASRYGVQIIALLTGFESGRGGLCAQHEQEKQPSLAYLSGGILPRLVPRKCQSVCNVPCLTRGRSFLTTRLTLNQVPDRMSQMTDGAGLKEKEKESILTLGTDLSWPGCIRMYVHTVLSILRYRQGIEYAKAIKR
jgi:hypothetical protein